MDQKAVDKACEKYVEAISIKTPSLKQKIMNLSGTWDVKELTDKKLVLSKSEDVVIGPFNANQTTVYSYHKVASTQNQ